MVRGCPVTHVPCDPEIIAGKHRRRRLLPPKVPLHPSAAAAAVAAERAAPGVITPAAPQQDLTLFEAYKDLQLRWKRTTRQSRKKFSIARKWRQRLACRPQPEPKWLLFLHPQMGKGATEGPRDQKIGRRRAAVPQQPDSEHPTQTHEQAREHSGLQQGNQIEDGQEEKEQRPVGQQQVIAPAENLGAFQRFQGTHSERPSFRLSYDPKEIFCVFKSSASAQHKVTVGDLVQTEKLHRKQAGDKVVFGTVLIAGTREWTVLGKPTVPFVRVKGVIEQQTLCGETLSFRYKKTRRSSRFLRIRHWVTMIRIEEIEVDVQMKEDPPIQRPKRLLDLWANRWLYPEELEGIRTDANGRPLVEAIYNGEEHQQGTYHRRGLAACYRWLPDPKATHWKR
ncbi:hypothetical protein, conserved [Eimeria tenella]|uniref:Large ribosomal subunit protein bL21m n=1 Tax=Eimeria tenella TaxID=5802 RepID=U6L0Z0_EIMTE|nr:hypothetical protein, conserved [Eimeria tenella]CDJ42264.1 hypothetical protein, conserved [Eimeria tenella]|eukprot:XP_013233014.1 hypothetical protein, conserved [Eimeria tenella]